MSSERPFRIYLCGGVHCTAAGHRALLRDLEDELWRRGLDGRVEVRVSGCQSRCEDAPNATRWPGPHHYRALTAEALGRMLDEIERPG